HVHGKFVFPRIAVSDKFLCSCVKVLLSYPYTLFERLGRWSVQYAHPRAWSRRYLDAKQTDLGAAYPSAYRPHLPRRKRVGFNRFVAVELWSRDKLLNAFRPHGEAEVCISEFAFKTPLLLLLDTPP